MKDQSKTKQELIKEISILKNEIMGLKRTELEHKLAREAIQESETKLQAIFDIVGTGIMIIDRNTQIIKEANQTAIDMVGLPKESIIGQICHSLVCPAQEGKCPVKDLDQSVDHSERKLLCADGHLKDVLKTVYPITIGGTDCYIESFIDISERKKAEEALQESEERYRAFVENASDIVFRTDESGHFTFINPAGLRITGYEKEELIGTHYPALINPDMCEETMKFFGRQFVNGIQNTYLEYSIIAKDKHEIWLGQNTQLIVEDGRVQGFQAVARDMTDRKRAEDARYHYEKLQGVLEMAGAICHEMNQPMQIISGYSEMLLKNISENDPIHTKLDTINKQIIRMGTITRKLMNIKKYETQDYAGISRIININESSGEDIE